jgi:RNA recognition motif-containing protein
MDPYNLYVKNLDKSITDIDLLGLFSPFGEIISAKVSVLF